MMKNIILLGSTGSIGTQTLDILRREKDDFTVSVLACGRRIDVLRQQIAEFSPKTVVVAEEEDARTLRTEYPSLTVLHGDDGLEEAASGEGDMVVNALVGIRGLRPTMAAIEAEKDIALANKETLVAGGELVMGQARKRGVRILPVDSEHSAVFQCLQGGDLQPAVQGGTPLARIPREIWLTASGGAFRGYTREALRGVTLEQALRHPNWSMGQKITVDSATMVNKGLEIMEAYHLFGVAPENIRVLVHPQSIVHSLVRFEDEAVLAQLGTPDMRIPISYALHYPARKECGAEVLDLAACGPLTFEAPDTDVFTSIPLAYEALRRGGTTPVAYNGANEELVAAFLAAKIPFYRILALLEELLAAHKEEHIHGLADILAADEEIRQKTKEAIARL